MTSAPPDTAPLWALGRRLLAEGQADGAETIFRHLSDLQPTAADPRVALAEALHVRGETLAAMAELSAARAQGVETAVLLPSVQKISAPAVEQFNARLQVGDLAGAERYAAALAELIPSSPPMLQAAMSCNRALGRTDQALHYARALLALQPDHAEARELLASDTSKDEIAGRMASVLSPAPGTHPLLQLRDLHDLSSYILCHPMDAQAEARVETLLQAAEALKVEAEPGSEWAGWEKHYRVLLDAVDLDAVRSPAEPSPPPSAVYADAAGAPLEANALRERARGSGAQAAFFVAADESYVDLYARWYVLSLIKYCELPFVVVVHVIGGAGRLGEIARKVGIDDERLVFSADDFDAEAVTTKVYDAPPKGLNPRPVAHFQSVRFLRLRDVLDLLELPVFVSDIDLLLQRQVGDLLDRTADADVVFNENEGNFNAGSRLTANLLLVRPTADARLMLDFLQAYLTRRLAMPEVTRWIDQVALILARHHLVARSATAQIDYFDTRSDINNVMYTSYQAHPFRFLSLYHGFDTSSLEKDPRVLGAVGKA